MLALAPAAAGAHQELVGSEPSAREMVTAVPARLRLTFAQPVQLPFSALQLVSERGASIALGPLGRAPDAPHVLVAEIVGTLAPGAYTVLWTAAGPDGHPVSGSYEFTVLANAVGAAAPEPPGTGGSTAQERAVRREGSFDAGSPLFALVRWLGYLAVLLLVGVAVFELLVLRRLRGPVSDGAGVALAATAGAHTRRVAALAVALLLAAAGARLYAQSHALFAADGSLDAGRVLPMLRGTLWGWAWLLQVGVAALAATALFRSRQGRSAGWGMIAVAAVAVAFVPALSGHAAAAGELAGLAIVFDGIHVLGAGGWLGTLLLVVTVGLPAALRLPAESRMRGAAALVNAFSPLALTFAGAVVTTGLFAAWLHVGSLSALWRSDYGLTLLLKLGLFAVVVAFGAYNWRRGRTSLGAEGGVPRLRRSAALELAGGALVLAVTSVLVATPPARDDAPVVGAGAFGATTPGESSASGSP